MLIMALNSSPSYRRAGALKASTTEDPVDSFVQDVALRRARLADNMQQYMELQQKTGHILNQVSRMSSLSMCSNATREQCWPCKPDIPHL